MSEFIKDLLAENKTFVEQGKYKEFLTTKFPDKKAVIISCMDTRLTGLLPAALNFKNGDVKIIKNAGGVVTHRFGSVMRSLMVAIYELGVDKILVIGHHDCGMQCLDAKKIMNKMIEKGIEEETLNVVKNCGLDLEKWLKGFDSVEESVKSTVNTIKNHPLIPPSMEIYGLVINPETGLLSYLDC